MGHRSALFDLQEKPIAKDPQERDREALEVAVREMPNFSNHPASDAASDDQSVEYPRHGGAHSPLPFNPYSSYGHVDPIDDFGYNPDQHPHSFASHREESYVGGETISTAAHHASGLTWRAGFNYHARSGTSSPRSNGGEYDPDRPLQHLLENRAQMSMFDDTIRSYKSDRRGANVSGRNRSNKSKEYIHEVKFFIFIIDSCVNLLIIYRALLPTQPLSL